MGKGRPRFTPPARTPRQRRGVSNPVLYALTMAATLDPDERQRLKTTMRTALDAFRRGAAGVKEWRDLADACNVGEELMRYGLANDHAETFKAAQLALKDVANRFNAGGSFTLRAAELEALRLAVLVHEVQLDAVAGREFREAVTRVINRTREALRGNGGAEVIEVAGALR